MARVGVPAPRAAVIDGPQGLELVIPAKRNVFIILFLGFWMVGWFFGEISAIRQLTEKSGSRPEFFLIAWLGGWTVGGAFAIGTWLWTVAGKERVSLRPGALIVRREVFGVGPAREYDLAHVSNLRVSTVGLSPMDPSAALRFWGMGGGPIAFDYGSKTIRFGASLDEAEGGQIVARLRQRHAFA